MTDEVRAEVNWDEVHPTVRQVMMEANVSGVHGLVTSATKSGRVEVTFTHDNDGNKCNETFWFDCNQVKMGS